MNKNDSEINLGVQAGMVYRKGWVRGSGKPISKDSGGGRGREARYEIGQLAQWE